MEGTRKTDSVEVTFNAIGSKKFVRNEKSRVCISFAVKECGGINKWWPTQTTLINNSDGHWEVKFTKSFSKQRIKKGIQYRYNVKRDEYDCSQDEYEYVCTAKGHDENNFRELQLNEVSDRWVQYDGMIIPWQEKGAFQFRSDSSKMPSKNIEFVAKYFFPKHFFETGYESGADMVHEVNMLYIGLEKNMLLEKDKEKKKRSVIGKAWLEVLRPTLENLIETPNLIFAVGIIVLWEKYSLPLEAKYESVLFQSMVLKGNEQKKKCPDYERLKETFQEIQIVKKALMTFIKNVNRIKGASNPTWVCSLPLLHFLTNKCCPYEEMTRKKDHNATIPIWWGTENLEEEFKNLKKNSNWSIDPENILKQLKPMFELDFYLPRAFMSSLTVEQLHVVKTGLLPPEVVMANLYYVLKTDGFESESRKKICFDCLEVVAEQMHSSCESQDISPKAIIKAYLCMKIGEDVLNAALDKHREKHVILKTIEIFVVALAVYELRIKKEINQTKNEMDHLTLLTEKIKTIDKWMNMFSFDTILGKDLQVWDTVLSTKLPDGLIKDIFMDEMKNSLQKKMKRLKTIAKEGLVIIYCNDTDKKYGPALKHILRNITFKFLEESGIRRQTTSLTPGGLATYGSILSELFEKFWKENKMATSHSTDILRFTLKWKPFEEFLEMFYKKKSLTQECQQYLDSATLLLQSTLQNMWTGQIEIKEVLLIEEMKDTFYDLNNIICICEKKNVDKELFFFFLKMRNKEIEMVKRNFCILEEFKDHCQNFSVDLHEILKQLQRVSKMNDLKLCEVCKPGTFETVKDINAYVPAVTAFGIPQHLLKEVQDINRLSKSKIFHRIWMKQGQKEEANKQEPLTLVEVIENVWQNTYKKWKSLEEKLVSGEISFKEFWNYFQSISHDDLEQQLEFLSTNTNKEWIKERLRQFDQYRSLKQCANGAKTILKAVDAYNLQGDFQPIRMIVEMEDYNTNTKMSEFDSSLIEACDILREITEEKAQCIDEFVRSKQLIDWLKKSIKNLKELKVFVDLASISAGEGDMDAAKVKCLHAATIGYAPLIFYSDDHFNFNKFLEQCKLVWKELTSDPLLPEKLRSTAQQLEWLNVVKSAQGSVEVTSMRQVKDINMNGIYIVGNVDTNAPTKKTTLDDVLKLYVQREENESKPRVYKYKELQELQSKLMLVAGKADLENEDVEQFTLVFDALLRLCNAYIKLASSGCVLFSNWQTKFLCDPSIPICAFIKFGSGSRCIEVKAQRNRRDITCSTIISRLAQFMDMCLEQWLNYIDSKRDTYYHLNFFTIDQLIILQKELALIGDENEPSNLIYPLLSIVKHDCSKEDLIIAFKKSIFDVSEKQNEQETEKEVEEIVNLQTDTEENANTNVITNFLSEIVNLGYSEKLVRQALKEGVDPEDIDEGVVWCMENSDLMAEEKEVSEEQVEINAEEVKSLTNPEMSISTLTEEILLKLQNNETNDEEDTVISDLEMVWKQFLSSISSSYSDFLSVEQLGILLKRLAEIDGSGNGESLQIIRITHEVKNGRNIHGLELKIENLEKIMFHPDVKEYPVVIISIAGSFRKGKSFLLGFFLKYLETQTKGNWLRKDDKIKGFEWRGGTERVTSGIHIWSKPFICENKNGEKVAVLLMDTQGVFDNDSTVKDCVSLFALSNLISSVQIYNLMQQLQEDDLQHLEFFTAFGNLVAKESDETDINNAKFIYLIRDWGSSYEYPYGKDGGNRYIKKQLEINSNQHEELKELRKRLSKSFPNIGGFLLPYPGKAVVTKKAFDGQVKDMDDDFVENVKSFVLHILSREMLTAKRIHNKTLTGEDIVKYIKAFVELLEKGEYPTPQTAFQATAEVGRGEAIKRAFKFYKDNMYKVCKFDSGILISIKTFETYHNRSKVAARDKLRKTAKMLILEHECECMWNLDMLIKEEYKKLRIILDEQIKNFALQQEASRAAAAKEEANSSLSKLKTVGTGIGIGIGTAAITFLHINKYLKKKT